MRKKRLINKTFSSTIFISKCVLSEDIIIPTSTCMATKTTNKWINTAIFFIQLSLYRISIEYLHFLCLLCCGYIPVLPELIRLPLFRVVSLALRQWYQRRNPEVYWCGTWPQENITNGKRVHNSRGVLGKVKQITVSTSFYPPSQL